MDSVFILNRKTALLDWNEVAIGIFDHRHKNSMISQEYALGQCGPLIKVTPEPDDYFIRNSCKRSTLYTYGYVTTIHRTWGFTLDSGMTFNFVFTFLQNQHLTTITHAVASPYSWHRHQACHLACFETTFENLVPFWLSWSPTNMFGKYGCGR